HHDDVGFEVAVAGHRGLSITSLFDAYYVVFDGHHRHQPFTHDRMVIHAQNTNSFRLFHKVRPESEQFHRYARTAPGIRRSSEISRAFTRLVGIVTSSLVPLPGPLSTESVPRRDATLSLMPSKPKWPLWESSQLVCSNPKPLSRTCSCTS